jgi:hypothetical protein
VNGTRWYWNVAWNGERVPFVDRYYQRNIIVEGKSNCLFLENFLTYKTYNESCEAERDVICEIPTKNIPLGEVFLTPISVKFLPFW